MADLGVSQKPIVMPSYPHMLAEDTAVWSKYLAAPVHRIKEVWYDVHVGRPVSGVKPDDKLGMRIASGITRKRIDVVARVGGGLWVVEIKPFAGMMALGQILSYTRLFIEEYRPEEEVRSVVVCDSLDPDLVDEFEDMGVVVIET
ncbi:hypothetical protein ES705_24987 [subsurface metagenome]